jgi:hypothetical protein
VGSALTLDLSRPRLLCPMLSKFSILRPGRLGSGRGCWPRVLRA